MGPNPNGPRDGKLRKELLDTQVCSGSVTRGSDRWEFFGIVFVSGVWSIRKNPMAWFDDSFFDQRKNPSSTTGYLVTGQLDKSDLTGFKA